MHQEPTEEQINYIIESLQEFHRHSAEIGKMDFTEMRNFMEPRFAEAGYRQTSPPKGQQTKILILRDNSGIGDFILTSPAIREIRRVYPKAYIVLLATSASFIFAEHCPYVDEIIIDERKNDPNNLSSTYDWNAVVAKDLLAYRFDIAFAFEFGADSTTALLAYMSGARERISTIRTQHQLFVALMTVVADETRYGVHTVDSCLSCLEALLRAPVENRKTEIWLTPTDRRNARHLLPGDGPWYAICVGGVWGGKRWPAEYYAEFMQLVAQQESVHYVILGGPSDCDDARKILSLTASEDVADLTGQIDYRQTAVVVAMCDYCIGNDTGATHIAAAFDVPVLQPHPVSADMDQYVTLDNRWHPYEVPCVLVKPEHALPECKEALFYGGCTASTPHCITQVKPKHMMEAFQILKDRAAKGIKEPYYFIARDETSI